LDIHYNVFQQSQSNNIEFKTISINSFRSDSLGNFFPESGKICSPRNKRITAIPRKKTTMSPKVSIVIPVKNNLNFTEKCLSSIKAAPPRISYDIIVIDNASDDGTREFLEERRAEGELDFIRNDPPQHFAISCNQGAEKARGEYLMFLNNDTEAFPGWLDEMVKVAETADRVGAVGAKLMYPDYTIQHAGVAFYNSDIRKVVFPYHIFKDFPRYSPAVTKRREFKCVTGACLLTPWDLFFQIGRFDETYVNCFEDVDYCLNLHEAGYKIIYTPDAELIHHEGQTAGRSDNIIQAGRYLQSKWSGKISADDDEYLVSEGFCGYEDTIGQLIICLGPELKKWWDLTIQLMEMEQFGLAIKELTEIEKVIPGNAEFYEAKGRCQLSMKDLYEAKVSYEKAILYDDTRIEPELGLILTAIESKMLPEAERRLTGVIEKFPDNPHRGELIDLLKKINPDNAMINRGRAETISNAAHVQTDNPFQ